MKIKFARDHFCAGFVNTNKVVKTSEKLGPIGVNTLWLCFSKTREIFKLKEAVTRFTLDVRWRKPKEKGYRAITKVDPYGVIIDKNKSNNITADPGITIFLDAVEEVTGEPTVWVKLIESYEN